MTDILDPSALLHVLPSLLPSSSALPSSTPLLRHPSDALAALIHTIMTRLDFRLTGLSETDRLATPASDTSSSSSKLPANWNTGGPDHYSFRYKHHQSSLDYLVKLVKLGNKMVIHGIAMQGTKTSSVEVVVSDWMSDSFWPWPKEDDEGEPLVNGYIGSSRVKDLTGVYKRGVLQELVPGLTKDGYTEQHCGGAGAGESRQPTRPDGGEARPRPEHPSHPPAASVQPPPYRNPLIIGDRDLDPLGGSPLALPPRFGGGTGGGGFAPPPLFPGGDTGGGMHVGPNHPMFRDRFAPNTGLPPGAVPPGARFDPIYPAGGAPFNPDREPDVGGARPQTFPGEPDWDELAPPRAENPFAGGDRRAPPGRHPDTRGWYS